MIFRHATEDDIDVVVVRMREHCRREMTLTRAVEYQGDEGMISLAVELHRIAPHAILRAVLCADDEKAIAIFAAYRASAAVALFQTFSTDDWHQVARPFIGWFNKIVAPLLTRAGIRMAEFNVLDSPDFNARWFALMGARPWGPPLPRGRRGELYHPMVWLPAAARERLTVPARGYVRDDGPPAAA